MTEIPYWKQQQLDAEAKKELAAKYPLAGKIVSRMGEYGVIIPADDDQEYYIRYDNEKEDDMEGLYGLPYEETPDYVLKYINLDGTLKK